MQRMLEALLVAEELAVGVLNPARAQGLVRKAVNVLEDQEPGDQPRRQRWQPRSGPAHRTETLVKKAPVDLPRQAHQRMTP